MTLSPISNDSYTYRYIKYIKCKLYQFQMHMQHCIPSQCFYLQVTKDIISPISDSPKPPPKRVTMTFPMINNCECAIFASCGGGKAEIVKVCFLLRYNVIEMKGRRLSVGENTRIRFIVELCSTRSIFYHHSFDDV